MNLKSFIYRQQLRFRQRRIARAYDSAKVGSIETSQFAPTKVLFILAGLIGDSVMSIPAIEAGRRLWPGAEITVLGKKHNRELIAGCDFFDEFYEFNADPFSLRRSGETRQLEAWLKGEGFDAVFILLGDQFAHLLARADIPVRVGVKGTALENCLTHVYDIGSPRAWGTNERMGAIRCLGYETGDIVPELKVEAEITASAWEKLRELGLHDDEYLILHPFGSTERQWWKIENIRELADAVSDRHNLRTVLIGGPEVTNSLGIELGENTINTVGKLSLKQLLAVIAGSKLVVTTDSGPFHIAGAFAKPTVGLFRARRPEHAGAYKDAVVVFGKDERCMQTCEWDRCDVSPCRQMHEISTAEVLSAIDDQL